MKNPVFLNETPNNRPAAFFTPNWGLVALVLWLACAFVGPVKGQDLKVVYDLFTDSVTYFCDGKPQKEPRLRKGRQVHLHLTEYNPFLYDIELKIEESYQSSGGGMAGLAAMSAFMPGLTGFMGTAPMGDAHQAKPGGLPLLDIPLLTLNDNSISLRSLFERSRGSAETVGQANQVMLDITRLVEEVGAAHATLKRSERALRASRLALANVDKIILNPSIRPSLVKKMCREYYETLFQKTPGGDLSLHDLLDWQDLPGNFELQLQKIKEKQGEMATKSALLQAYSDQLTTLGAEDPAFRTYLRELVDFQGKTRTFNNQLKDSFSKPASLGQLPAFQELADLQLKLAEILSNDFTWHSTVLPTADEMTLVIRVLQKPGPDAEGEPTLVKERKVQLEVRGGLKVSASVGLAFGQFSSPIQSYSVGNGVIIAENEGIFSPSVASFLHFHGYRGQRATLGATFGIGVPVLTGSENQSIQFFLGPSLSLGSTQKLMLTGGLMGGRVQRLAKGLKAGEEFDANLGDIPTRGRYELGAFLGLSFNFGT